MSQPCEQEEGRIELYLLPGTIRPTYLGMLYRAHAAPEVYYTKHQTKLVAWASAQLRAMKQAIRKENQDAPLVRIRRRIPKRNAAFRARRAGVV